MEKISNAYQEYLDKALKLILHHKEKAKTEDITENFISDSIKFFNVAQIDSRISDAEALRLLEYLSDEILKF